MFQNYLIHRLNLLFLNFFSIKMCEILYWKEQFEDYLFSILFFYLLHHTNKLLQPRNHLLIQFNLVTMKLFNTKFLFLKHQPYHQLRKSFYYRAGESMNKAELNDIYINHVCHLIISFEIVLIRKYDCEYFKKFGKFYCDVQISCSQVDWFL